MPIIERSGPGWRGRALIVPAPSTSDLEGGLDLEEVDDEVTISFDHSHIHRNWPAERPGDLWSDALILVGAILNEKVAASSGWIDDELRVGALHESDNEPNLLVPGIQLIRIRSWLGTFDRDISPVR
ncbi:MULTISPECIES: hypothetical protein [unclassified Beijerinckia]|uniref:hypothetical protein n=1 Tax=unclassified Beijerinckia TaxID=2638183 RepID=UPI00147CC164|nr:MULTISPECIES: hypothetical protein [unclassified Beijerinckia]